MKKKPIAMGAIATSSRAKKVVQDYLALPLTDLANENLAQLYENIGGTEENIREYKLPGHGEEKKKVWKLRDRKEAERLLGTKNQYELFVRYTDGSIARFRSDKNKQANKTRKAKRALQKTKT